MRTNTIVEMGVCDMEVYAVRHNDQWPDQPVMPRSATVHVWLQDQYDADLADWEARSRKHLMQDHGA